jgi:hypothetical protein
MNLSLAALPLAAMGLDTFTFSAVVMDMSLYRSNSSNKYLLAEWKAGSLEFFQASNLPVMPDF